MILDKLSQTPAKPGVYLLRGHKDRILYVGKAKNLKNRLKTYFQRPQSLDARKASMVTLVIDFSYIITENELEALILEANLIKQYKPRFNVVLRDDKNYPYLKLTIAEEWPRLLVVRRIVKDGSLYFGPYVPAQSMWDALAFIRRNFPIRICNYALDKPMRPCIQYQMGRCPAPCALKITRGDYLKIVEEVRLFLSGERGELLEGLEKKMVALSDELKFEEAARIRDRITHIQHVWESQRVVAPELGDMDVIGFYSDNVDAVCDVFFIRNGVLIGTKDFYLKDLGEVSKGEVLHSFIELFYAKEIIPPDEIIVMSKPDDLRNLTAWLKEKKGGKVGIRVPLDGKRQELIKMATENAEQIFRSKKDMRGDERLKTMKERLHLPYLPHSIGAFDVSTTSGTESVGAFIYWQDNEFVKDCYRHLRIKGVPGIDDYSMMSELITRTLKNLGEKIPDLIVIDGGKGHLEIARDVIETNRITLRDDRQPMLISVAKDPDRAFILSSDIIDLEDRSPGSLLLKRIRDEVHRFAVTFHRKLRDRRLMKSPLEKIPGVGKKRRFELLRFFGSIDAIRNASVDEIASIKGFNKKVAENVFRELRRQ
ncbi:MAG: excinuclease ABC subunit UvrC [Nitrospirae bacterium]|nr:excinuclease ABC subunit UvrC [Nitrospirota bacterium]MCL5421563.1 excinuclease ABC subunit UvrC [Nitrospirota bacterium]